MKKFLLKRLGISIVILFFVTFILYTIMRWLPTSYIENKAREMSGRPGAKSYEEWIEQLEESYGYDADCSIPEGYVRWLYSSIKGEFGDSWWWNVKVTDKFTEVIGNSFVLGFSAFILEILIAVPLGILSAGKPYSKTDYTITAFTVLAVSVPAFFLASVIKMIFSVKLGWFDLYGMVGRMHEQLSPLGKFLDYVHHLILPVLTLTMANVGALIRHVRMNMLEVLNQDFIRTARAKGLSQSRVLYGHAFRNTWMAMVTILGRSLPGLFGGTMIIEILFQIEGIGYTSYQSMVNGDIPFAMFCMTFFSILVLVGNLLSDILYAAADPRVHVH